jgi:hypothetical protein
MHVVAVNVSNPLYHLCEQFDKASTSSLGHFKKASTASLGRFKWSLSQAWGDHDEKQYGNGRQETHWQPTVVVVTNQEPREHTFTSQLSYSPRKPTWPTLPSMTRIHSAHPFRVKNARRIYSPQKQTWPTTHSMTRTHSAFHATMQNE